MPGDLVGMLPPELPNVHRRMPERLVDRDAPLLGKLDEPLGDMELVAQIAAEQEADEEPAQLGCKREMQACLAKAS